MQHTAGSVQHENTLHKIKISISSMYAKIQVDAGYQEYMQKVQSDTTA